VLAVSAQQLANGVPAVLCLLAFGTRIACALAAEVIMTQTKDAAPSEEQLIDRAIEDAVVRAVFGHDDLRRRAFLELVGKGAFAGALASVFPLAACKEAAKESLPAASGSAQSAKKPLEKTKLNIGFVPITCATPINHAALHEHVAARGLIESGEDISDRHADLDRDRLAGDRRGRDAGGRHRARYRGRRGR
jgi:hypothetical protein